MNIDAEKVIERLMQRIAGLIYENTVLAAALAEYEAAETEAEAAE